MKTTPLYPYQERVNTFTEGKPRVGIFSYYGSGKTYLSLHWLESLHLLGKQPLPCLVLTMKTPVYQWGPEIAKHTSNLDWSVVVGDAEKRVATIQRDAKMCIVNYDAIRSVPVFKALTAKGFRSVIADESTRLKNARTLRFKTLRKFVKKIPFRAILTGKPIQERPEDIWAQALFLDDGQTLGTSFWKFRHTYFAPGPPWDPYVWYLKEGAGEAIAALLNKSCIQITKEEVGAELPPQRYVPVVLEMPEKLRKLYRELKKEFAVELPSGEFFTTKWAMVKSAKLHQLCQGFMYTSNGESEEVDDTKMCWLEENLPLMLEDGPILLWTSFKALLQRTSRRLAAAGIQHEVLTGEMNEAQRDAAKNSFQRGDTDVLLLSQQVGHAALNLQRAGQSMFISSGFEAEMRENAEQRCQRIGSEGHEHITYYDLIMKGSVDEVVRRAHKHKLDVAEELLKHIRSE